MSDPTRQPMRRDALANRERIIDTAEIYFRENGLDAPLQGLAAAAKVGAGTLYRNFASHADVVRALYERYIRYFDDLGARALALPTGWDGIELVLRDCQEYLVRKGIVSEVMRRQAVADPDYRPSERWVSPMATLVERAIAEGSVRPDLVAADVSAAAIMLGSVQPFAPDHHEWISRRMLALCLDGMRAHPHEAMPLPPIPDGFDGTRDSILKREP